MHENMISGNVFSEIEVAFGFTYNKVAIID